MSMKFSLGELNLWRLQLPHRNSSQGFYYCFWTAGIHAQRALCVCVHACTVSICAYAVTVLVPGELLYERWWKNQPCSYANTWALLNWHTHACISCTYTCSSSDNKRALCLKSALHPSFHFMTFMVSYTRLPLKQPMHHVPGCSWSASIAAPVVFISNVCPKMRLTERWELSSH